MFHATIGYNFLEYLIALTNIDEKEKSEIIQLFLPFIQWEDIPIEKLFYLVWHSCKIENSRLTKIFIDTFYAAEFNSLYPLIKQIEAAIEKPHYICIFLHEKLLGTNIVSDSDANVFRHMKHVRETLLQLLVKDIALAVNIFKEFIKHDSCVLQYLAKGYEYGLEYGMPRERVEDSQLLKLLFQLFYYLMDHKNQEKIDFWMISWLYGCRPDETILYKLLPITQMDDTKEKFYQLLSSYGHDLPKINQMNTLEERCENCIRTEVRQTVDNLKDFIDQFLQLRLPNKRKCDILDIPHIIIDWTKDL